MRESNENAASVPEHLLGAGADVSPPGVGHAPDSGAASVREQEDERLISTARETANTALRNPYALGGRGSALEQRLARTVLALLEDRRA